MSGLSEEDHVDQMGRVIDEFRRYPIQTSIVARINTQKVIDYVSAHWRSCIFPTHCEGNIAELFFEARYRGRQIGQQLRERVTREIGRRSCARLVVTNNRQRESYQRGFYRCCGWSERFEMAQLLYSH